MITAPTKNELRKLFLMRRERLMRDHPEYQAAINTALANWLNTQEASIVGAYWPFRAEPDILGAIRKWLSGNALRKAALPVIDDKAAALMHYAQWSPNCPMHIGAYGIAIPKEDVKITPEIILLPCLAFNSKGVRLGSGAGFYDRYLAKRKEEKTPMISVAIAFEKLRCDDLVAEAHDKLFDWILTESGIRPIGA